ncbi:MAG: tRNA preQ1(34) S-adenosylmethionine ribosyltransferase-isomerase QueA [Betaproteobacteria bacterium]
MNAELKLSDFDFELPPELIAQSPPERRGDSRLLHVAPQGLADLRFAELEALLRPDDLLVFNDTRVIKARLHGEKASGGKVEALVERVTGERSALAMLRASKSPKPGGRIAFGSGDARAGATVTGREGEFFVLEFDEPVLATLERLGEVPLPPYITHPADAEDERRYQTVYAAHPGAVAAPTAGLHFTPEMIERLVARGIELAFVTLHVGAGTFQPVRVENLAEHRMHAEWYRVGEEAADRINAAKAAGRRVVAVGTTSLRTLESAATAPGRVQAGARDTALFVTPGYKFRVVDALITNFHLPKSTLLMLVSALAGRERILAAYAHAVAQRYRFFSYGDAMLIEKDT